MVALALSGAHVQWEGEELKIPARLDANQPAPSRLALNPQPFQPVVPIWVLDVVRAGFGVARGWNAAMTLGAARIPDLVLCPSDVEADDLLAAAENRPAYFLVAATAAGEAEALGRKLVGPLRMPEFPDWINA